MDWVTRVQEVSLCYHLRNDRKQSYTIRPFVFAFDSFVNVYCYLLTLFSLCDSNLSISARAADTKTTVHVKSLSMVA